MIRKPSAQWDEYMQRICSIKTKSNREVLCTYCWTILNYEQRCRHSSKYPHHLENVLTSSQYANEAQFYHIAQENGKVISKADGTTLIVQPSLYEARIDSGYTEMIEELAKEMHGEGQLTHPSAICTQQPSYKGQIFKKAKMTQNSRGYRNSSMASLRERIQTANERVEEMTADFERFEEMTTSLLDMAVKRPTQNVQEPCEVPMMVLEYVEVGDGDSSNNWSPSTESTVHDILFNKKQLYKGDSTKNGFGEDFYQTSSLLFSEEKSKEMNKERTLNTLNKLSASLACV